MSLTAYDNSFSFRQNELATKGETIRGLTADQREKLKESPFMKRARLQEDATMTLTTERDRRRKERDSAFKPGENDFSAVKAYDYDKQVNYYKVLGVDELASLDDVKKAYKKLSLSYHPDKTTKLSQEEQDEYVAIFIEIKNAYLTLGDQSTRRQYDRDRDHMSAGEQVHGYKKRPDKVPFDASLILRKLQEIQKPPGKVQVVTVECKLEKLFYGGSKVVTQNCRVIRENVEYWVDKPFRIDIPRGTPERLEITAKGGNMNWNTQSDTLNFNLVSKTHPLLERNGDDLRLKRQIVLKPDQDISFSSFSFDVDTLAGRAILVWGRNPFGSRLGSAEMNVTIAGEGFGRCGQLRLLARLGSHATTIGQANIFVEVKISNTKLNFVSALDEHATFEELEWEIRRMLELDEMQEVSLKAVVQGSTESKMRSPSSKVAKIREVLLTVSTKLCEVPMSIRRARDLLDCVTELTLTDEDFKRDFRKFAKSHAEQNRHRRDEILWGGSRFAFLAARFAGCSPDYNGVKESIQRALWILRDQTDCASYMEYLGQFGFFPKQSPAARKKRRKKVERPAVEHFFQRNRLGPPSWGPAGESMPDPDSETDPEQSEDVLDNCDDNPVGYDGINLNGVAPVFRPQSRDIVGMQDRFAANGHPQMVKRLFRRNEAVPVCCLELEPMLRLHLHTKPSCSLQVYSNLRQSAVSRPGCVKPQCCFAVSVCCLSGAKRSGRMEWWNLRRRLVPVLRDIVFLAVRQTRCLIPRPLKNTPVCPEYSVADYVRVNGPGEKNPITTGFEGEGWGSEDERYVVAEARSRLKCASCNGSKGDGIFDFDDLEDSEEFEKTSELIRSERFETVSRKAAMRQFWVLDARRQAREYNDYKAKNQPVVAESRFGAPWWKEQAGRAFKRGEYFTSEACYTRELFELPADDEQGRAVAFSNRSACRLKIGQCAAALEDALTATKLRPAWGRAWVRYASAAADAQVGESRAAWFKAVTLEPSSAYLNGLVTATRKDSCADADLANEEKEHGNKAMRKQEFSLAVAHYTVALAKSPHKPIDPRLGDSSALLRSIIYANRSAALSMMRLWDMAVEDATRAVEQKEDFSRAHVRLGVAELGAGLHEKAYVSFARALKIDEKDQNARRGRDACLSVLPLWTSVLAKLRWSRFNMDMERPKANTRVYSVSDVNFDQLRNEEWVNCVHATKFLDDVLCIAGNVGDSLKTVELALKILRSKFRRVFFTPGNHESWIKRTEETSFPDSFSKLLGIMEVCDSLEVDVFPASIGKDIYIVPLFSWCNAAFDLQDPFPNAKSKANKLTRWPIDKDHQLWRYMLRLNHSFLSQPYRGTIITMSHFAPSTQCAVWPDPDIRKTSGCAELDEFIREVKSSCHIYGHTLYRYNEVVDGIKYVHRPLSVETELDGSVNKDPLLCVFNGQSLCQELVDI